MFTAIVDPTDEGFKQEARHLSVAATAAVRRATKRPRVVAAFTTFPIGARMKGLAGMLQSLADQSWPLDAIIMSLPDHVERISPEMLPIPPEAYEYSRQYKNLVVHQTTDRGPGTKLLGALEVEKDPDTVIVVLDDDTYYHNDTVLTLMSTMLSFDQDVAPAFMCEEVIESWSGKRRWAYQSHEGFCHGFASGYAAFAVRPRFFDHKVWDLSQGPVGCRLHDDVWISGSMLVGRGIRPYLVRPGFDSVAGQYIKDDGKRQEESVNVANRHAQERGLDPQGDCVSFFPFSSAT